MELISLLKNHFVYLYTSCVSEAQPAELLMEPHFLQFLFPTSAALIPTSHFPGHPELVTRNNNANKEANSFELEEGVPVTLGKSFTLTN